MTGRPRVGVLGGLGAVGGRLLRLLHTRDVAALRVGVRREREGARFVADHLGGAAELSTVDVLDDAELSGFCAGCDVVVNCAGPTHRVLDRVARAALAAGADYVDVGGDEPVHQRLVTPERFVPDSGETTAAAVSGGRRRVVLSAGMLPGLSGLLPRYLAGTGIEASALTVYHGVRDRFSAAGAADFLFGLLDGSNEPLAGWHGGERVPRLLKRQAGVSLPFFPERVVAYPYLTLEGRRTARELRLREAAWYTVFEGTHLPAALDRLRGTAAGELDTAVAELCTAAELDVQGRLPHATLLFQLDGVAEGEPVSRTLVVRSGTAAELVAHTGAAAMHAVLDGNVAPGVHFAAQVLDPDTVVAALTSAGVEVSVVDHAITELAVVEEGAL